MVLNNLFYITAKFADQHPQEVEECWATLCSCWPNNLKVIIRYLIIVSGMAPHELLPYVSYFSFVIRFCVLMLLKFLFNFRQNVLYYI